VPGGGGEVAYDVVFEINDGDDLVGLVGEVFIAVTLLESLSLG
jgi:hypothetical protein